jgi:hypothetical protein
MFLGKAGACQSAALLGKLIWSYLQMLLRLAIDKHKVLFSPNINYIEKSFTTLARCYKTVYLFIVTDENAK